MVLKFNNWNIDLGFVGSKVCRCSRCYCHMCSKYLLRMDYPGRCNVVVIVYLMWVVVVVFMALLDRLSSCSMGCENRNSFTQSWWTSLTWYAFWHGVRSAACVGLVALCLYCLAAENSKDRNVCHPTGDSSVLHSVNCLQFCRLSCGKCNVKCGLYQ